MQQYYSTYERFENDSDDSQNEGFEGDSDDEGFDGDSNDEGFTDDDSDNEGFKSKSKARKALEKTGKSIKKSKTGKAFSKAGNAIKKSAKKTGNAIKKSKLGKAISKAGKSLSKRAKKFKRTVIDPELIRAQTQARIAQIQMEENSKAMISAQKYASKIKSSIDKQVQNPELKAFNPLKGDVKKSASLIFVAFALVLVIIIYVVYSIKYGESYVTDLISNTDASGGLLFNIGVIAIICFFIVFLSVIFKGLVLKKDISKKHIFDIITTVATIGLPIFAITMLTIDNLPLMKRSFENTIGYSLVKGSELKKLTQRMFGGNGNYNDYSIIATQLNKYNIKAYLSCMKQNPDVNLPSLNRFPGIFLGEKYFENGNIKLKVPDKTKPDEYTNDLFNLTKLIVKKSYIGDVVWVSAMALLAFYSSNVFVGNIKV